MKRFFLALVLVGLTTGITGTSDVYAISEQDIIDRLEGLRMSVERQQETAAEEAQEREADEDRDVYYLAEYLVGGLAFVFDNDKNNLEATFDLGMASVMAGYAFFSGDNDGAADNEDNEFEYGFGDNWRRLFILTSDENPVLCENLGGAGNLSIVSGNTAAGTKLYYAGASFTPMENLKLGVVAGIADANKVPDGRDADIGTEYDFTLNWKIYDNLTYTAIAAYLDAGDFWKFGAPATQIENTYALFHQLELTF